MGGEDEKKFEGFSKDENGVFRIADVNDRKCTDFFCVIATLSEIDHHLKEFAYIAFIFLRILLDF